MKNKWEEIETIKNKHMKEKKIKELFDDLVYSSIRELLIEIQHCESPIEKIMYISLHQAFRNSLINRIDYDIHPQEKIKDYRLDFLVQYFSLENKVLKIGIECDGHEFHEKTKEQAKRDKSRDREIIKFGVNCILRFTGSEIYRNSYICANEVIEVIESEIGKVLRFY